MVCVVAVSYSHTLALFGMGGFTGIFQHMAVIAVEVTFLLGALNMVVSRFKGQHPGIPAIIGGLFGVGIVGWGNIEAGVNYGIHGIVLGAAIPISLIIAESILSKAILQRMKEGQAKEQPATSQAITKEPSKVINESPSQWEESPKEEAAITQSTNEEPEGETVAAALWELERMEPMEDILAPVTKESNNGEANTKDHHVPPIASQAPPTGNRESPKVLEESPSNTQPTGDITQAITKELEATKEEEETSQEIETDPEKIYAVAWELWEQSGETPTRRGLAEAANTTEHRARTAITRLKAELEQMQREVVAS